MTTITITPHGTGYDVTTRRDNGRNAITYCNDLQHAARTAGNLQRLEENDGQTVTVITETRLVWPLYVEETK